MSEKQLPILIACRLSVRYEVNQLKAVPDIPYHVDKRVMRMSWSMVSKAADRSSRVNAVTWTSISSCMYTAIRML